MDALRVRRAKARAASHSWPYPLGEPSGLRKRDQRSWSVARQKSVLFTARGGGCGAASPPPPTRHDTTRHVPIDGAGAAHCRARRGVAGRPGAARRRAAPRARVPGRALRVRRRGRLPRAAPRGAGRRRAVGQAAGARLWGQRAARRGGWRGGDGEGSVREAARAAAVPLAGAARRARRRGRRRRGGAGDRERSGMLRARRRADGAGDARVWRQGARERAGRHSQGEQSRDATRPQPLQARARPIAPLPARLCGVAGGTADAKCNFWCRGLC